MTGYELLVKELTALQAEVKQLRIEVSVLLEEKAEREEAERKAQERNAEMWRYYQEEEYKARHKELEREAAACWVALKEI